MNFYWLVIPYFMIFYLIFVFLNHKMHQNYLVFFSFLPLHFISWCTYIYIYIYIYKEKERYLKTHIENSTEAICDLLIYTIALLIFWPGILIPLVNKCHRSFLYKMILVTGSAIWEWFPLYPLTQEKRSS
jgi:carbon starvation protein CstA